MFTSQSLCKACILVVVLCFVFAGIAKSQTTQAVTNVLVGVNYTSNSKINTDSYSLTDYSFLLKTRNVSPNVNSTTANRSLRQLCRFDKVANFGTMLSQYTYNNANGLKVNQHYQVFYSLTANTSSTQLPIWKRIATPPDYTADITSYELLTGNSNEVFYWTYVCREDMPSLPAQKPDYTQCSILAADGTRLYYPKYVILSKSTTSASGAVPTRTTIFDVRAVEPNFDNRDKYMVTLSNRMSSSYVASGASIIAHVATGNNVGAEPYRERIVLLIYKNGAVTFINVNSKITDPAAPNPVTISVVSVTVTRTTVFLIGKGTVSGKDKYYILSITHDKNGAVYPNTVFPLTLEKDLGLLNITNPGKFDLVYNESTNSLIFIASTVTGGVQSGRIIAQYNITNKAIVRTALSIEWAHDCLLIIQ